MHRQPIARSRIFRRPPVISNWKGLATGIAELTRSGLTARSSVARSLSLKQEPKKDSPHFFKGRLGAVLGHGQRVRSFGQLVDLIIVRQFKSDFHSMDSNCTGLAETALPVPGQPLIDRIDAFVVRLSEGVASQIKRLVSEYLFRVFAHVASVSAKGRQCHSYFPRGS